MSIAALVAFATYLKGFLAGQEDDKYSKLDFFVPFLLVLPICAIMPIASVAAVMKVAGAMIAALFFASLAIVVCLAQRLVADAKVAKTAKIIAPRIATLALALVVVGCCFAPCFKAVFEVQFSGKSASARCETTPRRKRNGEFDNDKKTTKRRMVHPSIRKIRRGRKIDLRNLAELYFQKLYGVRRSYGKNFCGGFDV